jgi:membrane-bound lytic murein transglycosylase D
MAPSRKAWLVLRSGPLAGARHPLLEGVLRVGRAPDNDVVVQGPQSATVSLYHLEITCAAGQCRIRDVGSTNGTYLDGNPVTEADLPLNSIIRLGSNGPEFGVTADQGDGAELDRTLVLPAGMPLDAPPEQPLTPDASHESLLSEAVQLARQSRAEGEGNQTLTLMRNVLAHLLRRRTGRFRLAIVVLAVALLGTGGLSAWRLSVLRREGRAVDEHIRQIEQRLEADVSGQDTERLIAELSTYQDQARSLEHSVLYRYAAKRKEDFVTRELRTVLAEFGADTYSVPPGFVQHVNRYIEQYRGADRSLMEAALNQSRGKLETIRKILVAEKLPPDLAFMPLVESALELKGVSAAGAAGPWQLTPSTARAFGLRVDSAVDERFDLRKSTRAGCRYMRELILDFGAGASVMLALAAYNLGPGKVKQAIMKVEDPIKQRNFWYLYRARALPSETREYVPRVFAAILIGRNPDQFGFAAAESTR